MTTAVTSLTVRANVPQAATVQSRHRGSRLPAPRADARRERVRGNLGRKTPRESARTGPPSRRRPTSAPPAIRPAITHARNRTPAVHLITRPDHPPLLHLRDTAIVFALEALRPLIPPLIGAGQDPMIRPEPARPYWIGFVVMLAGCVSAPVTPSTPECVAFRTALGRYMDAATEWAEAFVAAAQQRRPTAESARTYELMQDARRLVVNAQYRAERRGCPACPAWAEAERAWGEAGRLASRLPQNYESARAYFEWHLEAAVRAWRACGEGGPRPVRAQRSRATSSSPTFRIVTGATGS